MVRASSYRGASSVDRGAAKRFFLRDPRQPAQGAGNSLGRYRRARRGHARVAQHGRADQFVQVPAAVLKGNGAEPGTCGGVTA